MNNLKESYEYFRDVMYGLESGYADIGLSFEQLMLFKKLTANALSCLNKFRGRGVK